MYYGKNRDWYSSNCKEVELEMNPHTLTILFQKDSSHKYQFCTKVCAPWELVSEHWAKYKDVPTKILKDHEKANPS